jgi:DegV family protein with EDD domain
VSLRAAGIRYLDGRRLRRAMIAGAAFVTDRAEPLNKINVFPVPDGDTGTNMAITLGRIAERASQISVRHARQAALQIADEAVAGARGNSGAILAQFLTGFAEAVPDEPRIESEAFGRAVLTGSDSARAAIQRPQEGTILTVLREWAQHLAGKALHLRDFADLLADSLKAAKDSLSRTPEKMALLKKSGVVDAGAQGFVFMLEGIVKYIREAARGTIPEPPAATKAATFDRSPDTILFRYCTEALVEGGALDRALIRRSIALLGDSLVIAGSSSRMRVHVHTNEPEAVFAKLGEYGSVVQTKMEDMRHQHELRFEKNREGRVAIVTDSACSLPESLIEELNIQVVPLRVHFGTENYLDGVTIKPAEFYGRFAVSSEFPRTSQPPPADFRQVYESLARHHASIVSIHLSSGLSGTFQAAVAAARGIPETEILRVDSKNAAIGEGLIVRAAAEAIAKGATAAEAVSAAESAAARVRFFVTAPTVEHLVRGGRLSGTRGFLARLLGVLPVLTVDREGKAAAVAKAVGHTAAVRKMMRLLFEVAGEGTGQRFAVAHADEPEAAEILAREIRGHYPSSDVMVLECSPVIGAHAGPGALGVAVLP